MMRTLLFAIVLLASPAYAEGSTYADRDRVLWQHPTGGHYDQSQQQLPRSGYHDDECREIRECVKQPACIQSDWRWYAARNRSCEPADESTQRAFLCYLDGLGQPQRWKMLRFMPLAEASFEAQMRNQAQCR